MIHVQAAAVTIQATRPVLGPSVTGELTGDRPKPAGGGGWEFKQRPRRSGMTQYQGVDPYTLTFQLLFDRFEENGSVEPEMETLRRMMRDRVSWLQEPAVCTIQSKAIPMTWLEWVINDITYDDELLNDKGERIRAFVTLTMMQYLPGDIITTGQISPAAIAVDRAHQVGTLVAPVAPAPAVTPPGSSKPSAPGLPTVVVANGDTLETIAARILGDAKRWREIGDLNGIRDPRNIRVGQVLKVPQGSGIYNIPIPSSNVPLPPTYNVPYNPTLNVPLPPTLNVPYNPTYGTLGNYL